MILKMNLVRDDRREAQYRFPTTQETYPSLCGNGNELRNQSNEVGFKYLGTLALIVRQTC